MKFKISWLLYFVYILFIYWAFEYNMVQSNRELFAICFILVPMILDWIRKIEYRNNKSK